jgi:hypothetical protein
MAAANKLWTTDNLDRLATLLAESTSVSEGYAKLRSELKRNFSSSGAQQAFRTRFAKHPSEVIGTTDEAVESRDELALAKRKIRELKAENRRLAQESETAALVKSLIGNLNARPFDPPRWLARKPNRKLKHGTPTLMLSDLHHGEVVRPEETSGANIFNMEISRNRIKRVVEQAVYLLDSKFQNPEYPGFVLACGGDMLSGNIHEELRETNEAPIFDALCDLAEVLAAAITLLAERFGKVYVPWVVGNHGRLDRKPRMKRGPADNYEYMLGHHIAAKLGGDKRITVDVADGYSTRYVVHGTRYLLHHGDGLRGGTGITGPLLAWMRGDHKLRKQRESMSQWGQADHSYDQMLIGHFHTYCALPRLVVNGSIKGFDAYAAKMGFDFEPPRQALWLTHPKWGPIHHMPIYAEERS